MALLLTSKGLRQEIARQGPGVIPPAFAAGAALGTLSFLHQMKPGGMKTLVGFGCVGGGGFIAWRTGSKVVRSMAIGTAAGGLWSLLMRG